MRPRRSCAYTDMKRIILRKNRALGSRVIDRKAYVISLEDEPCRPQPLYVLNETATRIWQLIDGRRSLEEITARLSKEFDAGSTRVIRDTRAFIRELMRRGLLTAR